MKERVQRSRMALGIVGDAVAAVGGLIAGVLNYMTDMFLSAPLKATLNHLEDTELKTLTGGKKFLPSV